MFHISNTLPPQAAVQKLTFSHFGRKGYSLFAALGREVRIGVLSVATLATAAPALAAGHAGQATLPHPKGDSDELLEPGDTLSPALLAADLSEAVAVASRAPMAPAVAARTVTTLTRADIEAAGVSTVSDLVKLCAAVDVRQRGPHGVQTDIAVAGGTFDQVAILLNGINISSPHTGHLSADLPVTAQDIERIEVIEGAAARVYGTSAFTGAINIVTRTEQRAFRLHGYGGQYGYAGGEGRISLPTGRFHNHLSGGYTRSDGATPNSDFASTRAFWQGSYATQAVSVDAQVGYSHKPYGANTFYGAASTDQWEQTDRWMGAVKARARVGRLNIAPQIYWNRWYDHYQWHRGQQPGSNRHQVDVYGAALNDWVDWNTGPARHTTAFGLEMRSEGIRSTKLGNPLSPNLLSSDSPYTHGAQRTHLSGFLDHTVVLSRWTLSAGVLALHNTSLDTRWHFYPGVDVAYRPGRGSAAPSTVAVVSPWRLSASWNMALRLPTFTDLYYSGAGIIGNTALQPEKTSDFALRASYTSRELSAEVSPFLSHRTDLIDWVVERDVVPPATADHPDPVVPNPADPATWVYRSVGAGFDAHGVRVNAAWTPRFGQKTGAPVSCFTRSGWTWHAAHPVLRRLGVQYCWMDGTLSYPREILASKYAMDHIRHKVVVSADGRLYGPLTLSANLRYCDRTAADPYTLVDARLSCDLPLLTLYVQATNLFDVSYTDYAIVPQPGRWIVAGIALKL